MALPTVMSDAFAGLRSMAFGLMTLFVVIAALVHLPGKLKIWGAVGGVIVLWLVHKLL